MSTRVYHHLGNLNRKSSAISKRRSVGSYTRSFIRSISHIFSSFTISINLLLSRIAAVMNCEQPESFSMFCEIVTCQAENFDNSLVFGYEQTLDCLL